MTLNLKHQLRYYMKHANLSAQQLAKELGIPKSTVGDWLTGAVPRDLLKLKKTALFFEVTVDHLLFGSGELSEGLKEKKTSPLKDYEREVFTGIYEVILRPVRK